LKLTRDLVLKFGYQENASIHVVWMGFEDEKFECGRYWRVLSSFGEVWRVLVNILLVNYSEFELFAWK